MSNYQQNRLSMYLAVLGVMAKYNAVWAAMTAIADMVTRLQDLTSSIQEASGVQGSPLTGIAGGKRRKRMVMMEKTVELAGDLHALAVKHGNADLEAKSDLELSDLVRLGEPVIAPRCQEIHTFANANRAELETGYGVETESIVNLQTAINEFKPLISKAREAIVNRKEATGDIVTDEATADRLLKKELDGSMRKFKSKNPAFFGEYTSGRMIIDLGVQHEKKPEAPQPEETPTK